MHDPKDHILKCILFIKWKINRSYKYNLETTVFKSLLGQDVQMQIWVCQGTSLGTVEESWRLHFSSREREKYCVKDDVMPQQVKWELFLLYAPVVPEVSSGPMLYFVSPRILPPGLPSPDNAQIRVLSLCYFYLFLIKMYLSPVHSLKFLVYDLIKYFMVRFK